MPTQIGKSNVIPRILCLEGLSKVPGGNNSDFMITLSNNRLRTLQSTTIPRRA